MGPNEATTMENNLVYTYTSKSLVSSVFERDGQTSSNIVKQLADLSGTTDLLRAARKINSSESHTERGEGQTSW